MSGVNKVILVGNLGQDPVISYAKTGMAVAEISIATSRSYIDKNNEKKEEVEWHKVKVFGKQAEACQRFLKKGKQVYVEGRLQTSSWDDKEGNKRYKTEVISESIQFLGGQGTPRDEDANKNAAAVTAESHHAAAQADDIPF